MPTLHPRSSFCHNVMHSCLHFDSALPIKFYGTEPKPDVSLLNKRKLGQFSKEILKI